MNINATDLSFYHHDSMPYETEATEAQPKEPAVPNDVERQHSLSKAQILWLERGERMGRVMRKYIHMR